MHKSPVVIDGRPRTLEVPSVEEMPRSSLMRLPFISSMNELMRTYQ
jgi:hypothetical protein